MYCLQESAVGSTSPYRSGLQGNGEYGIRQLWTFRERFPKSQQLSQPALQSIKAMGKWFLYKAFEFPLFSMA
ncbi:hypothetical protein NQ317_018751 [Molorchus minor]|uniref:Uncharacterized protein n=1 Tax=Molorchus minor TaxID=1323400 RepID=A0ABQ9JDU1_9CUCU|nr:hypothetical protein NQ317_018751 [Molorchus minor]